MSTGCLCLSRIVIVFVIVFVVVICFFFFNDTATTEIYTLSLHDALPICASSNTARAYRRCNRNEFDDSQ